MRKSSQLVIPILETSPIPILKHVQNMVTHIHNTTAYGQSKTLVQSEERVHCEPTFHRS